MPTYSKKSIMVDPTDFLSQADLDSLIRGITDGKERKLMCVSKCDYLSKEEVDILLGGVTETDVLKSKLEDVTYELDEIKKGLYALLDEMELPNANAFRIYTKLYNLLNGIK